MDQEIEKILKEHYLKLPEDVKNAIKSVDWSSILVEIGKNHRLHIDQTEALKNEVILVMFGLTNPDNFVENLELSLEVSPEEASLIAGEVNSKILLGIRESLKKIHEDEERKSEETPDPTNLSSATSEFHEKLDRAEVLHGIENPESVSKTPPAMPAISDAALAPTENNPVKEDILQGIEEPQIYPAKISEPASSIVDKKLNAITTLPKEEVKKEESDPRYKIDPYREPLA